MATTVHTASRDRFFYTGMAVLAMAIVFIGFSPTFYQRSEPQPPLDPLYVVHGIVFTAWFLLFIVQTALIAVDRRSLHRVLGTATVVLAALMVGLGVTVAVEALRRGAVPVAGLDPRQFFAVPMFDMLCFPLLVGAAWMYRRNPEAHKRLMLLATLSILAAAFARFPLAFVAKGGPIAFFGLVDLCILAAMAYDLATRRRVHPAYLWGGLFVLLSQPVRLAVSGTPLWLGFADLFLP